MEKELKNPITFKMKKGNEFVTMGEFREATKDVPDDYAIIMSRDSEGNGYLPLYEGETCFYNDRTGDIYFNEDIESDEYKEYLPEMISNGKVKKSILLVPIG